MKYTNSFKCHTGIQPQNSYMNASSVLQMTRILMTKKRETKQIIYIRHFIYSIRKCATHLMTFMLNYCAMRCVLCNGFIVQSIWNNEQSDDIVCQFMNARNLNWSTKIWPRWKESERWGWKHIAIRLDSIQYKARQNRQIGEYNSILWKCKGTSQWQSVYCEFIWHCCFNLNYRERDCSWRLAKNIEDISPTLKSI